MAHLLIIEDGDEYKRFFSRYIPDHAYTQARDLSSCLDVLGQSPSPQALVVDLRFDRVPREQLTGDAEEIAEEIFGGDIDAAWRYVIDNQGFLLLRELRQEGHHQPALLITEMTPQRLENLKGMYGDITAVPSFDQRAIAKALDHMNL